MGKDPDEVVEVDDVVTALGLDDDPALVLHQLDQVPEDRFDNMSSPSGRRCHLRMSQFQPLGAKFIPRGQILPLHRGRFNTGLTAML
jgi:hypothetical protein